jgi:histone-lysine N-methyltransferase SETMAR
MVLVFFDVKGILVTHFMPHATTMNKEAIAQVLNQKLRHAIREKRPELREGMLLHHDNARLHTAGLVQSVIEKTGAEVLPHPPYSLDLAPCDFFLFPRLKKILKGKRFEFDEELQKATAAALRSITNNGFQEAYEAWIKRWKKCIYFKGEHFEKEKSQMICHMKLNFFFFEFILRIK